MDNLYRHYKGMLYRSQGVSLHSETLEPLVRYQCLYKNDLGSFWVRPKKMFEETVIIDGKEFPRFAKLELSFFSFSNLSENKIDELFDLAQTIFTDLKKEKFLQKISLPDCTYELAYADQKLAGFKIGFKQSSDIFYSWLGGVDTDFRRLGIAKNLLDRQIETAKKLGCKWLQTKSMPIWPEMMVFNLKNGFDIKEKYQSDRGEKFLLEKAI